MSWRDRLQPASFRGVKFHVASHNSSGGGRRHQLHQYAGRDEPFAEDLGQNARRYRIEAYVIGADYDRDRNRLIEACDKKAGAADLVHPYLGTIRVLCADCTFRELARKQGLARFSLTFVSTGENRFPSIESDGRAAVNAAADGLSNNAKTIFKQLFSVDKTPEFIADAAADMVTSATDFLTAQAPLASSAGGELRDGAARIAAEAGDLIRNPAALADRLSGLIDVAQGATDPRALFANLADFGGDFPAFPQTTATRLRQLQNQTSFLRLLNHQAVAGEARALAAFSFVTRRGVLSARDDFAGRLDGQINAASTAGDRNSFRLLRVLKTETMRELTSRAPRLARVIRIVGKVTEPALIAAQRLYGDPTRAGELARRNAIRHPGFVPGGATLEALTNGDEAEYV